MTTKTLERLDEMSELSATLERERSRLASLREGESEAAIESIVRPGRSSEGSEQKAAAAVAKQAEIVGVLENRYQRLQSARASLLQKAERERWDALAKTMPDRLAEQTEANNQVAAAAEMLLRALLHHRRIADEISNEWAAYAHGRSRYEPGNKDLTPVGFAAAEIEVGPGRAPLKTVLRGIAGTKRLRQSFGHQLGHARDISGIEE